jgi:geranylgeranyl pyrophosphate synthase
MAVLGGDSVTFSGVCMLAELGRREVLAGAITGKQMCAGMVVEAADQYVASRGEQSYLDAIDGKTAAVLSLACRVGAMQAGRHEDEEEALALFGRQSGWPTSCMTTSSIWPRPPRTWASPSTRICPGASTHFP